MLRVLIAAKDGDIQKVGSLRHRRSTETPHELATYSRKSGTKMPLTPYRDPIDEKIGTTAGASEALLARYQKSYLGSDGLFCKRICFDLVSKNKNAYAQESQADSRKAAFKLPF
jgi:hypothetical protein